MTKDDQKNSRKKQTNNPFVWHTANRNGKYKIPPDLDNLSNFLNYFLFQQSSAILMRLTCL